MSEGWYPRYFQSNVTVLNNAARKKKSVKVKMIGLQGCLTYGVRTRFEWTALTEDINEGCEKEKIRVRPSWQQVEDLSELEEELEWADKRPNRIIIVCSVPSQIGNDKTIMRQVEDICQGREHVELTFSEAGNAASMLFESMSITAPGSGGGGHPSGGGGETRVSAPSPAT